jgi:hypothetical protein
MQPLDKLIHDLQIQGRDGVYHGNHEKRDECGNGQSPDLGVAQGLLERSAVQGQRNQGKDRGGNGDHHGPKAHDAGIEQGSL